MTIKEMYEWALEHGVEDWKVTVCTERGGIFPLVSDSVEADSEIGEVTIWAS